MAIEPSYIYYNKRITESLLGNPVNLSANLSREAILFHQLNEKAVNLKSALGLLENTVNFQKQPEPIYKNSETFSLANDLRESLSQASKYGQHTDNSLGMKDVSTVIFSQGTGKDLAYVDTDIIDKPNKISAAVFIKGLEKAFQFWTLDPNKGGVAPTGSKERLIVEKYQHDLKTLELGWTSIGNNTTGTSEADSRWYESLYKIPGDFVASVESLQKGIHEAITEIINLEDKKPTAEEIESLQTRLTTLGAPGEINEELVALIGRKVTVELLKPIKEQMIDFGKQEYPNVNKISVFWQDLMGVYQDMLAATYPGVEKISEQISENVEYIDKSRECIEKITNFVTSLKDFLTVAWTQPGSEDSFYGNARYGSLVDNYMLMGGLLRLLSDGLTDDKNSNWPKEIQTALKEFFNSVGTESKFFIARQNNTKIAWSKFMGALFAYQACVRGASLPNSYHSEEIKNESTYWQNHDDNKFAEVISEELKRLKQAYDSTIGNNANSNAFVSYACFGVRIFTSSNSSRIDRVNPRFLQQLMDLVKNDTTINWGGFQDVKDAGDQAIQKINEAIKKKEEENKTLLEKKNKLDPSQMNYALSMSKYQKAFIDTSPLQTSYVSLLLDKYFPEQNHILKLIGGQMVFSNRAARELNKIVQDITMFQASDVYYSLSLYLRQMNLRAIDNAKGKAEAVKNKELERTQADLTRCMYLDQKIDKIIEEVKQIKKEEDPDPVKRKEFLYKLYQYKNQVASLRQNLCNLKVFLQGMTFENPSAPDSTDKAFQVSIYGEPSETWLRQLAILESFVVEGGNKGEVPGGEQQFLKSVEAEEQNYTTFNQNQQLALQMETSAIQQEWTIVTTGLGLLNQIFSKIIRRIKS
ncbi:CT620/CT621 family type III secretion system effector [Chlamydiifrater volucris]|uniref:CT620/CT621 family type III secretion system effector n=1 Tax=Chlamydiifrater volucris TaxID=2681470 RepID=UPI001BCBE396|nr:CT620/CT621 family type III secretion system effector [Chlamydiifrater volucris]